MEIVKNSFVILTYEDGWYHFYIYGHNEPDKENCVKSESSVLKNVELNIVEGILELTGTEYIKNGIIRDKEVERHTLYSGNYKVHLR